MRLTDKLIICALKSRRSVARIFQPRYLIFNQLCFYLLFVADSASGRMVNCVSVNRFDMT